MSKLNIKTIILMVVALALGGFAGAGIDLAIRPSENKIEAKMDGEFQIEFAEEIVPAEVVGEDGQIEEVILPTVEEIDDGAVLVDEIPEGEIVEEDALGAWHDTSSAYAYYQSVGLNACILNGYGAQCFALASDFWVNYAGRPLSSCGTGAAKGTLNCIDQNAGGDFEMIWDANQIQPGDWVVFTNGQYGHIGMAMGYSTNGYVALFGQNQGGGKCPIGGAATNVINISLKNFGGAFRPKAYIVPEPVPVEGEIKYTYVPGDTFGQVIRNLGIESGAGLWGANGDVRFYTAQLLEQGIVVSRDGKFYGNIPVGREIVLEAR